MDAVAAGKHWMESVIESDASSRVWSVADQHGTTKTVTESWQEVLEPIIAWFYTVPVSIEEQRHQRAVEVQSLGLQEFFLKRPMTREVLHGRIADVERYAPSADRIRQFVIDVFLRSGIYRLIEVAERIIDTRWAASQRAAGGTLTRPSGEYGGRVAVRREEAATSDVDVRHVVDATLRKHGYTPEPNQVPTPEKLTKDDDKRTSQGWL